MSTDGIYLSPYDDSWPKLAAKEITIICDLLPKINFEIEHIGSTAIPGLSAKPIIDLLIGVDNLTDAKLFIEPLENIGYSYWRTNPKQWHLYFVKGLPLAGGTGRTHHVHIYEKTHEDFHGKLIFRDYLRTHSDAAQEYFLLKKNLLSQFSDDREAYTDGKTDLVKSILIRAGSHD
jgi:GrpB-like predicted nucleotidyltransferase (UPF0157 family)